MTAYDLTLASGTAAYSTATFKFGDQSRSNGIFTAGSDPCVNFASGVGQGQTWLDGTVEGWFYRAGVPSAIEVFASRGGIFWIGAGTDGKITWRIGNGASTIGGTNTELTPAVTGSSVCNSAWHHFAIVFANAGGATLYIDGVSVSTVATNPTIYTGSALHFAPGGLSYDNGGVEAFGFTWGGFLDEVAVSNVKQYTAAFTPPSAAFAANRTGQVALYHFDSTAPLADSDFTAAVTNILPNNANLIYSPGSWDVTSARAKTINSASYFRTMIQGGPASITLNFDLAANLTPLPQIMARVDNGPWTVQEIAATVALTLPTSSGAISSNAWGQHVVEVVVKSTTETQNRWTAQANGVTFTGISTTPSTCTAVAIFSAPLRGMVFGDSITEGVRTELATAASGKDTDRNDATHGWAYNLRHNLGAEVGAIGFGATGWLASGSGGVPGLQTSYALMWGSGPARSFSGLDFIVINQGTNEAGTAAGTLTAAVSTTLNSLLAASTTAQIFVMRPFNGTQASAIIAGIAACSTPARVTYVDTTGWWNSADASDSLHPYGYASLTSLSPRLAQAMRAKLAGAINRWSHS